MRKLNVKSSLIALFVPFAAQAAGTYYTGYTNYYQPSQQGYSSQTYAQRQNSGQYTTPSYSNYSNVRYNQGTTSPSQSSNQARASSTSNISANSKNGFWLNAGLSRETAMWQFDMKESGSILHYDNVSWNVLDVTGGYTFDMGNTKVAVDAGIKYGMQAGETTMVDDDVTNGGFFISQWINGDDNTVYGNEMGRALSIGTSEGGNMLGFNVGIGIEDFFKVGNVKITPSVGFRYFKYKLETKKNYGLNIDTTQCIDVGNGETQCLPIITLHYSGETNPVILWYPTDDNKDGFWDILDSAGLDGISPGDTFYYELSGISHSYDVTWMGPYIALDLDYLINQNNAVNARMELGLPGYNATGDQPYRIDWQHPKSVEDEAGIGGALHFGLGANWTTAITNSVALSIGLTYDYYSVSDADAKTYLNQAYYTDRWNEILADYSNNETAMLDPDTGSKEAISIKNLEEQCPGWVCSASGEIESFYKSMGIRVGVNAIF